MVSGDTPAEPLAVVVGRVRAALAHLDPARVLLAPDCGLMTISGGKRSAPL